MIDFVSVEEIERNKKDREEMEEKLEEWIFVYKKFFKKEEFLDSNFWVERNWLGRNQKKGSFLSVLINYCLEHDLCDQRDVFKIIETANFDRVAFTMSFEDPKTEKIITLKAEIWKHVPLDCMM